MSPFRYQRFTIPLQLETENFLQTTQNEPICQILKTTQHA